MLKNFKKRLLSLNLSKMTTAKNVSTLFRPFYKGSNFRYSTFASMGGLAVCSCGEEFASLMSKFTSGLFYRGH